MEQRIAALERANRQLKFAVVILFVLAFARLIVPASAQQAPDVVRAGRFEVVRDGKALAVLAADQRGGQVEVFQTSGTRVGELSANESGGMLNVLSKTGGVVGYFEARPSGAEIAMGLGDGMARIRVIADGEGGKVHLGVGDGKIGARVFADSMGGGLNLNGPAAREGIWMRGGEPSIYMREGCFNIRSSTGLMLGTCR